MATQGNARPHVVIVGAGFGGLTAAQSLADAPVDVTIIDRSNHHLFQPLLYQVATAGLSPAEIAAPVRGILAEQHNARVLMAEVKGIATAARVVKLGPETNDQELKYDFLIVATGARNNYFGHDAWAEHALGLKSIDDAVEIRRRVLLGYEAAEREADPERRKQHLTFVVIGGGPTGVEMAGALAELSRYVVAKDFRSIHPKATRVILIEAGPRVLAGFHPDLSEKAEIALRGMGVDVWVQARVTEIGPGFVQLGGDRLASSVVIWAAGVQASELTETLGVALDRGKRVLVEPDCSIPGHPEVFCIGDLASFLHTPDKKPLPGVSPVAMQQARFVAKTIVGTLKGEHRGVFHYFDKGSMATIGRSQAVLEAGPVRMDGFLAWVSWLFVHIWYLIGFRNRLVVMLTWAWSYFTYKRGARLITGPRILPGASDASARALPPPTSVTVDPGKQQSSQKEADKLPNQTVAARV